MKKILVINMNYLGDALMTTPAIRALRTAYPDARIDTVVGAGPAAEVLRGNADLNGVIERTARGSVARCRQVYDLLRREAYTDAVILPPLPAYALTAFLARTPTRAGLAGRGMDPFLTDRRPSRATHLADLLLDAVPVPAGARPAARRLYYDPPAEALAAADALLAEAGVDPGLPRVAIHAGATRPQKRWPAERFARTVALLPDCIGVVIGHGPVDQEAAAVIERETRDVARPTVNLVGRTPVPVLAALLSRCDALLSGDSGPMHLAIAVGTPVVSLFGSTDPAKTGPYGDGAIVIDKRLPCAPCGNRPTCDGRFDCMTQITPDEAALAVHAALRRSSGRVELPIRAAGASG